SLLKIYDDFEKAQENLSPVNADGSRNENFSPKSFIDATNNLEKWANDHPDKAKEMPELQKTLEKAGKIRDEIAKPMQSLAERNQGAALKTRDQLSKDVDKVAAKDSFKEVDTDDEKTKAYKSSAKALNEATKAHEKAPTKENETKLAEAKKAFVDNAKTAGKSEDKDAQSLMKASDLYEKTDKIAKQGKEITQDEADNTTKDIYKYLTEEHRDDGKKILKTISDGAADADALIKAEQEKAKEAADKAADDSVNSIDDSISIGE
ncbi:MAG: hypothetical protein LW817_05485, partial [Candidatus Caenarcaniphilales bacterium]|nr:hypothetical protein [Candidatus Caenarcaniphilales bacterium]